ncbi:hypothetical protein BDFB_011894 [Asbolus verrucosus]|uniref:Uncharacterized protein n=1 Tax=Asbolus verrucosus TaxID=1661398 RepID=A0A482W1M6_ASBVE|nr:hypothetical protein BDFB_011894 [Asbolus verrucosus]
MKFATLIFVITLSAVYAFYVNPNIHGRVSSHNNAQVFKSLADFFNKLSVKTTVKRCGNTFDESCANGAVPGAASDEEWLANGPGKRCANFYDESCMNGNINGASPDEAWINVDGNTPGRR